MSAPRALTSADFRNFRPTKRLHGVLFSLALAPRAEGDLRFACVVSKKVAAKAVQRNLIKRRARSVLSVALKNVRASLALVFQAKRTAAEASFAEVRADLEDIIARAGLVGAR